MLKIRLRRMGRKKQPTYRVVIAESTSPRDGKFVEIVGSYNPRTDPETVQLKKERVLYWLQVGAQPTESVARILRTHGVLALFERLRAGESLEAVLTAPVIEDDAEEVATEEAVVEEITPVAEMAETPEMVEVVTPIAETPEVVEEG
ncbi:MAG TPA: 30S ribosomal protein S16 [Thermoflexia bacterium]|nr:30S ribosomal protein S16 [Thermoflexia bacterium]